jgi:glycerol-3-phosphate dehydrogenase (NAD(P)+)
VGDLFVTCQGGRTSRLGRWLGLGLSLPEAIAAMEGATLESLDVIGVWAEALPVLERQELLKPDELPLLRHLCAIVTDDSPADVPFGEFYREMEGT